MCLNFTVTYVVVPFRRPGVRPLAKARCSFAPVSIRGHCPPVGFAGTYMQRVRLRRTALRATPRMNTSAQPPEGAGGSRSTAEGELTLGLMSGEERRVYTGPLWERACSRRRPAGRPASGGCAGSPVGAGLPAKAACQPTRIWRMYRIPCGSEPAREGGLLADLHLADVPDPLWERACPRRRPASRPESGGCTRSPVGASLLAKAACQPTRILIVPTLCVGMPPGTLRVPLSTQGLSPAL
jgi:hypothetical protein